MNLKGCDVSLISGILECAKGCCRLMGIPILYPVTNISHRLKGIAEKVIRVAIRPVDKLSPLNLCWVLGQGVQHRKHPVWMSLAAAWPNTVRNCFVHTTS